MSSEYESFLSLGRIGSESEEDRHKLESAASHWLRAMDQRKWPRALQYFENASYLMGNHLTGYYYDATRGFGFSNHNAGATRFDSVIAKTADNRLIRPVETVVGMLTQNQPMPRVEPNSEMPDDEDAADLASIVVKLLFEKPLDMPESLREAALVAMICGTAFCETEYGETDFPVEIPKVSTKKVKNPYKEAGDDEPDEIEVPEITGSTVEMLRDFMADIWTPFHITVDPAATSMRNLSWIGRSTYEDMDTLKAQFDVDEEGYYPENLEQLQSEGGSRYTLYWWSKFQDVIEMPQAYQHGGFAPQTFSTEGGYAPNQTIFTVLDVKPSREYPKGRTMMLAGGKLLYCSPKDVGARAWSEKYRKRWHPYGKPFHWFKVPGKFWGIPLLSMLVPLQKRINAIDARIKANREYISIGQWLIPKHAKIQEGRLSGLEGEHYTYTDVPGMHMPEKVGNVPLPPELIKEKDDLIQAIDYIAASAIVGEEVAPSAARAGSILDFLRNEKLRAKSPMLQGFEGFVESIGQNLLIEAQLGMNQEDPELTQRIRMAAREYSDLAVEAFTGASLRDHHAVKIDVASELMHSPEALEAKALEFLSYRGQAAMPHEVEAVMRAIKMDRFVRDQETASVKKARRMVAYIRQGRMEAVLPMPGIEVATAMLPVFKNAILADTFHDLPGESKQALLQVYEYYAQAAQRELEHMRRLEMAMAERGGVKPEESRAQERAEEAEAA